MGNAVPSKSERIFQRLRSFLLEFTFYTAELLIFSIVFFLALFSFSLILTIIGSVTFVEVGINVEIQSFRSLGVAFLMLPVFLIWIYLNEKHPKVGEVSRSVAKSIWNATTYTPTPEDPNIRKSEYDSYKRDYVNTFSKLFPLVVLLLLLPVPLIYSYFSELPLSLMAGIYLILGILLGSAPRASAYHSDNVKQNPEVSAETRHTLSTQYEILFLSLAAMMQTAGSFGMTVDRLFGVLLLFGAAFGAFLMAYSVVILFPTPETVGRNSQR
ncbi:hypothetical protein EXE43_15865 [Halorubrum sp. SS5]|nr:hypothetical protein EXE43_15865 [Halorubrum sp. SS5]